MQLTKGTYRWSRNGSAISSGTLPTVYHLDSEQSIPFHCFILLCVALAPHPPISTWKTNKIRYRLHLITIRCAKVVCLTIVSCLFIFSLILLLQNIVSHISCLVTLPDVYFWDHFRVLTQPIHTCLVILKPRSIYHVTWTGLRTFGTWRI